MKRIIFNTIFLLLIIYFLYAEKSNLQEGINVLLENNYVIELDSEGFKRYIIPFVIEYFFMRNNEREINYNYNYLWIENNIVYEVCLLSKTHPNYFVRARVILNEEEINRVKETLGYLAWLIIDTDWMKINGNLDNTLYNGKKIYLSEPFFKFNENDEPATKLVIIHGEERYIWY